MKPYLGYDTLIAMERDTELSKVDKNIDEKHNDIIKKNNIDDNNNIHQEHLRHNNNNNSNNNVVTKENKVSDVHLYDIELNDLRKETEKKDVPFFKYLFSKQYLIICIYFVTASYAMAYYNEAAGRMFPPKIERILAIITPFSFLPCILIGKLIDTLGIMFIFFIINYSGVLMYAFACFRIEPLDYMSIICNNIYISVYTSQIFCYINQSFPTKHFGKLVGFVSCCGGLLSLFTHFLYGTVTVNLLKGDTLLMNIVFACWLTLLFPIVIYLNYLGPKVLNSNAKEIAAA